ncbi:MAG: nuclear transport factor 2 family protein [Longimicrobiales bacterium]
MRRLLAFASIGFVLVSVRPALARTAGDSAAIRATALDYVEGWYTGDAARMERALHPELAKRIVNTNPQNGRSRG